MIRLHYPITSPCSGILIVASYRHPSVVRTVEAISKIFKDVRELRGRDYLRRSIIGLLGEMDAPQSSTEEADDRLTDYLVGDDDAFRQSQHEQALDTGVRHFHELADLMDQAFPTAVAVALGARHRLERANETMGGDWLAIRRLL